MRGLDEWLSPASADHRNRLIDRAGLFLNFVMERAYGVARVLDLTT